MTKTRSTKRALLVSALALLTCVSMLVGSTFAWFTDSVTSAGNIIKSGTLDIEMHYADGTEDPATTTWTDASTGAIFYYEKWEPGYTEVRHIKIENKGSLALKYQLNIVANGTVSELADVIDVYYIDPAAQVADRAALANATKLGTLTEVLAAVPTTAAGNLVSGENHTITLALVMQESAGNEYQGLSIGTDFSVQLLATQLTHEEDSFDDQYDVDSAFIAEAKNAKDLAVALAAGGAVKLANDITTGASLAIPAGVAVQLDLNGKTLSGTAIKQKHVLVNEGTLTITGGTIASTGDDGGSAIVNKGTLTAKNVTLKGAPFVGLDGVWFPSYAVNNKGTMTLTDSVVTAEHGGVASTGGEVILNNVEITAGKNGITNAAVYTSGGAVVINGGTYTNRAVDQNSTGASVINGAVTVNAGTFNGRIENYYGTPVLKGGTFSVKPQAKFIAAGYDTVVNSDGTISVVEGIVVDSVAELATEIKKAPVGETTTIMLGNGTYAGDLDITVAALGTSGGDVVIAAAKGANPVIAGTVTLGYRNQGVGAATYNANVTFEGITFDHASNGVHSLDIQDVKSITLKDCKIIGDGEYGITSARGNATGASKIVGCTFENAAMQLLGNLATGLVIEDCTFNESNINVQAGNGVTVQNCVFNKTLTAANVGDSFYAIRSNSTAITVKNCEINVDSELTEVATAQAKWYLLANRGTTNWTVENVAVTLTDAALLQTELDITACTSTGVINTTNLTVNGVTQ